MVNGLSIRYNTVINGTKVFLYTFPFVVSSLAFIMKLSVTAIGT